MCPPAIILIYQTSARNAMNTASDKESLEIYTIGHSNHSFEVFFRLLDKYHIEILVDVRSKPYSRYASHFNKEAIHQKLAETGIKYLFLGHLVGGRPEEEDFYDMHGHVDYDYLQRSSRFKEGISRLLKGIQVCKVAVFCGEEDPTSCHRRLLIGRALAQYGVKVLHIRGDGSLQNEAELLSKENLRPEKKQRSLFDIGESGEWKSTT